MIDENCVNRRTLIAIFTLLPNWSEIEVGCYSQDSGCAETIKSIEELYDFIDRVYHKDREDTPDQDEFAILSIKI